MNKPEKYTDTDAECIHLHAARRLGKQSIKSFDFKTAFSPKEIPYQQLCGLKVLKCRSSCQQVTWNILLHVKYSLKAIKCRFFCQQITWNILLHANYSTCFSGHCFFSEKT